MKTWLHFIDNLEQRRELEGNCLFRNGLFESILSNVVKLYVEVGGLAMRGDTIILVGLPDGSERIPESHYPEAFVVLPALRVSNPMMLKLISIEDEDLFRRLWSHYLTLREGTSLWLTETDGKSLQRRFNTILSLSTVGPLR